MTDHRNRNHQKNHIFIRYTGLLTLLLLICCFHYAGADTTSAEYFQITDINGSYCTISGYTGTEQDVVVPSEVLNQEDGKTYIVQSLRDNTFKNNRYIRSVELPDSIETIGSQVFCNCQALERVTFGEASRLRSMGSSVFEDCPMLTDVTLSDALTVLSASAFKNCTSLNDPALGGGLKTIGAKAFMGCTMLSEITFPETLTRINTEAFNGCLSLQRIHLPDSVTTMSKGVFWNCPNLTEINYPAGLTTINASNDGSAMYLDYYGSPFLGSGITAIAIPEGVEQLPSCVFMDMTGLKRVTMADTVRTISENAFRNCGVSTLRLSENLERIGTNAFVNCRSLTEMILPGSVRYVEDGAFSGCNGLWRASLPEGMTVLEDLVFENCSSLTDVSLPESLRQINNAAFRGCSSLTAIRLPDGITALSAWIFGECTSLTEINYPLGLITVNATNNGYAMYLDYYGSPFCGSAITGITVPDGVEELPSCVFKDMAGLKRVTLPDSLKVIRNNAFLYAGVTALTLPGQLETIEESAFSCCVSLKEMTVPASVRTIGKSAFSGCSGLRKMNVQAGITVLMNSVFENCSGLTEVTLPETLTRITNRAFNGCTSLKKIHLPDSITTMSAWAFGNCGKLTEINYPAGLTTIVATNDGYAMYESYYSSPFAGSAIRRIRIPEGITTIPQYAFKEVTSLYTVYIPDSVTTIQASAFDGATGLKDMSMGPELETIGENAFRSVPGTFTIHGTRGTFAETFAETNGFQFTEVPLDAEVGAIQGVFLEGETPVAGVKVTLTDLAEQYQYDDLESGEDGSWIFENLPVNRRYQVSWYKNGYRFDTFRETIILTADGYDLGIVAAYDLETGAQTSADYFRVTNLNGTYCKITAYIGPDAEVVIPAEIADHIVQRIDNNAFAGNTGITKVTLPDTLETIGDGVFNGCTSLRRFVSGTGLTSIGANAFLNCTHLDEVYLADSMRTIGSGAFAGTDLNNPALGGGLKTIGASAFAGCLSLADISLPETLTRINTEAFGGCMSLKEIHLPDSVTTMSKEVFRNCTNLREINYPKGLTTINASNDGSAMYLDYYGSPFLGSAITAITIPEGVEQLPDCVFMDMGNLTQVTMADTVRTIGVNAFRNCGVMILQLSESLERIKTNAFVCCRFLTEMILPGSVRYVEDGAFSGCDGLWRASLPEGMTVLEDLVFENCSSLTQVSLPESLRQINNAAFKGCSSLTAVRLPDGITTLSAWIFGECTSLTEINYPLGLITVNATNNGSAMYLDYYGSPFCGSAITEITVPDGVKELPSCVFKDMGLLKRVTLPGSLEIIRSNAFLHAGVTALTLPGQLETIEDGAFSCCASLQEMDVPASVKTIGKGALSECNGLQTIKVRAQITVLYNNIFENCSSLTEVTLPETLIQINNGAFNGCSSLQRIHLPDSVTTMSAWVFGNCGMLTEINYPAGLTTINATNDGYAMYESYYASPFCGSAIREIRIPDGVTAIPEHAFKEVTTLQHIVFPDSLTAIRAYAFTGTSGLKSVEFPQSLTVLGDYAFMNSGVAYALTLPDGLTTFGKECFEGCIWLRNLYLNQLQVIPEAAFSSCEGLVTVTLPMTVTEIQSSAFANCINLEAIMIPASASVADSAFANYTDWKLKIYCFENSPAHGMAERNGIPYVLMDDRCALGHAFEPWEVLQEANGDQEPCVRRRVCAFCGFEEVETLLMTPVTEVRISAVQIPLAVGERVKPGTTVLPEDATVKALKWVSNAPDIVSVSPDGVITRLSEGDAVITVVSQDYRKVPLSLILTVTTDDMPKLVLPTGIRQIEAEAWMGDTSVQAVDLRAADAVQIGARAFGGCTALRKVLLCVGATYEADSFSGCENVVLFLPEENTTDDVEESALPWVTLVGGT